MASFAVPGGGPSGGEPQDTTGSDPRAWEVTQGAWGQRGDGRGRDSQVNQEHGGGTDPWSNGEEADPWSARGGVRGSGHGAVTGDVPGVARGDGHNSWPGGVRSDARDQGDGQDPWESWGWRREGTVTEPPEVPANPSPRAVPGDDSAAPLRRGEDSGDLRHDLPGDDQRGRDGGHRGGRQGGNDPGVSHRPGGAPGEPRRERQGDDRVADHRDGWQPGDLRRGPHGGDRQGTSGESSEERRDSGGTPSGVAAGDLGRGRPGGGSLGQPGDPRGGPRREQSWQGYYGQWSLQDWARWQNAYLAASLTYMTSNGP